MSTPAAARPTLMEDVEPRASTTRSRWPDRVALVAIAVVVALVSLPRLRQFALRENEADAIRLVRVLAAGGQPLEERFAPGSALARRVGDVELLGHSVLRRHGYLFDSVRTADGSPMVRAWPWSHQHTGLGAFVWTPERGLLAHANADGRFSGIDRPPSSDSGLTGWISYTADAGTH
ncbi:MAG: hypothetical protein ACKVWV_19695 [Planctomycetota bacterium]